MVSERLTKGLLRFVDIVAEIFIEAVRGVTDDVRTQAGFLVTVGAGPRLGGNHEQAAHSSRTARFVHNEAGDFGARIGCNRPKAKYFDIADDSGSVTFGDQGSMAVITKDFSQSRGHLRRG